MGVIAKCILFKPSPPSNQCVLPSSSISTTLVLIPSPSMANHYAKPSIRTDKQRFCLDSKGESNRFALDQDPANQEQRNCIAASRRSGFGDPLRRSARLRDKRTLDKSCEKTYPSSPPISNTSCGKVCQPLLFTAMRLISNQSLQHRTTALQANHRKRKRQQEAENELRSVLAKTTPLAAPARPEDETSGPAIEERDPIGCWRKERS